MGVSNRYALKLKLLVFKSDFNSREKNICGPFKSLIDAIEYLTTSEIFKYFMSITLEIGNFMNGSELIGFELEYLTKLSDVKDIKFGKPLLYHIKKEILKNKGEKECQDFMTNLAEFTLIPSSQLKNIGEGIDVLEEECKVFLGLVRLFKNYKESTREMVNNFLKEKVFRKHIPLKFIS